MREALWHHFFTSRVNDLKATPNLNMRDEILDKFSEKRFRERGIHEKIVNESYIREKILEP